MAAGGSILKRNGKIEGFAGLRRELRRQGLKTQAVDPLEID